MLSDEEKRTSIEKNWRLEDVPEAPFLIEIGGFHAATSKYFSDHGAELGWNADFHKQREGVYDYGMPNIKPNQGINIVASAFGCEYTVNDEADPWVTIPQTDWETVRKAAVGKTALCLRHYHWDHGMETQVDLVAYSKRLVDFFGRKGLFIQTSTPTAEEARELGTQLHRVMSR